VWRVQGLERRVEVNAFLSERSREKSFLVVWDNGCGMDAERIRSFATYFLGQEDRGFVPEGESGEGRFASSSSAAAAASASSFSSYFSVWLQGRWGICTDVR
jgi:hypothetical protein